MKTHMLRVGVCALVIGGGLAGWNRASAETCGPWCKGQWANVLNLDTLGVMHMVLLKNGKVLLFDDAGPTQCRFFIPAGHPDNPGPPGDDYIGPLFDGPTEANTGRDHLIACSGHAGLPDGRIVFVGGGGEASPQALSKLRTTIYDPGRDCAACPDPPDPDNCCWIGADDSDAARFYPTCTTLANGTVLTIGGWENANAPLANIPMIFDPGAPADQCGVTGYCVDQPCRACANDGDCSDDWRWLCGAEYCDRDPEPEDECEGPPLDHYWFHIPWYAFMFQISSGPVLYAGAHRWVEPAQGAEFSRNLDALQETWTDISLPPDPIRGGSGVMYELDQIMKAGGKDASGDVIATVATLDATAPSLAWQTIASLNEARTDFYLVVLPDGEVLGLGGNDGEDPVLYPELYDPANPGLGWRTMFPHAEARGIHSAAVLLPDGRVLIAGPQATAEVYSPPYLFNLDNTPATRPVIDTAPTAIQYGTSFIVTTNQAPDITSVTLIRLGASTHSWDQNQRFMSLNFKPAAGLLKVSPPLHGYQAPPGYYMLFIVDDNGVPSKAEMVKVTQ